MEKFLKEHKYIDFSDPIIKQKANELFNMVDSDTNKARIAFEFVRDEIPHSFDIDAKVITAKASDVLKYKTGICHAKSNLLAALLRSQNIPTGFCFQHLLLSEDIPDTYCVHCFNAIYVEGHWIKVDARGNTNGKNAQFSLDQPILAFTNRKEYNEYFWSGIYSEPHLKTMKLLDESKSLEDLINNFPDSL